MTGWQVFFTLLALVVSSASAIIGFGNLLFNVTRTSPDDFVKGALRWTSLFGVNELPSWAKNPVTYSRIIEWGKRILFACIVAAVIGGVKWYSQNEQIVDQKNHGPDEIPLADNFVHGRLIPANDPTPPHSCSRTPANSDAAVILMGDSAMGMNGMGSFIPLMIGGCPAMEIARTPEGVQFNAQLFDRDNNEVVKVTNNKIEALNGETYSARRSQDQGSITIKNKNGLELFYVRFLNKNTLLARGYFGCGPNKTVKITDDAPIAGLNIHHFCAFGGRVGINLN